MTNIIVNNGVGLFPKYINFDSNYGRTITYTDTELDIELNMINPILSEQDKNAPTLKESECNL